MQVFNFKRISDDGIRIYGVVLQDNVPFAVFIENFAKKIKTGEYFCKRDEEGKYVGCWELQDVTGRTEIIIHKANVASQLEGCIGIAEQFGIIDSEPAVLYSQNGFAEFMTKTKDDNTIKIILEESIGWQA